MGTRSKTTVFDERGHALVAMYRQFDGYPSGHGQELAQWLATLILVNGISGDRATVANGMGCLAAQMFAHFKTEAGGIYVTPIGSGNQEWNYDVHPDGETFRMVVRYDDATEALYDGLVKQFDAKAIED